MRSPVVRLTVLVIVAALIAPAPFASSARAATCTSSVGPGIPPPSVPSGVYYFHASWYGQSGYPTLCPGETSTAVIAYYNSGTEGWYPGRMGQLAFLGTWWPEPGQDLASALGGDGTNGSPATGWPRYNRVAAQTTYVGPGQVAWFQFTIKAPMTPGTYFLHVRPLIEGTTWMEDAAHWQVTVKTDDDERSVILDSASTAEDRFVAGGSTFRYDSNDTFQHLGVAVTMPQFEEVISRGDTVTMRYDPDAADRSTFNIAVDAGQGAPRLFVTTEQPRAHVTIHEPAQNVDGLRYSLQRGTFNGAMASPPWCDAASATYAGIATVTIPPGADTTVFTDSPPSGTHCYRAGAANPITGTIAFGYSVAVGTR